MRLRNKICVVTGGASGIGRATSLTFAREGATVVVVDRSEEAAQSVAVKAGGGAFALVADVSKSADVSRMVEAVVARCGRMDVLVNNAGYGIPGDVTPTSE